MNHLHEIDRYGGEWTNEQLEKLFVFCVLNRASTYQNVCRSYDALISNCWRGTLFKSFHLNSKERMALVLRLSGCRFYNQAAEYLVANNWITGNDLRNWTREEIVHYAKGIGMKLASMFVRNTREVECMVLDIHVKRFLESVGINIKRSYVDIEQDFLNLAKKMNESAYELDMRIWQSHRKLDKDGL